MDELISRQKVIDKLDEVLECITENVSKKSDVYHIVYGTVGITKCMIMTIQPEIIYCGDGCKFWNRHAGEQTGTCDILRQCTSASFYCGNAKRNEVTE